MGAFHSHAYRGEPDLHALVAFASHATAARWPGTSPWHAGDVAWMLSSARHDGFAPTEEIRLWTDEDGVAAVAWAYDAVHVRTDVRPGLELHDTVLEWAETRAQTAGLPTLSTVAIATDTQHGSALAKRGYAPLERGNVCMRRSLDALPVANLLGGFRLRDCTNVDLAARAAVHRAAWGDLAHLGIADARSDFTTERYARVRSTPVYDPTLDLVIEDADGQFACCAIGWADPGAALGVIEPVGTHPEYRGRGLARELNFEILRRMSEQGLEWANIGTASFNDAARTTYLSCGFEIIGSDQWYLKRF